MWEHCILNEMHGHLQTRSINYWRDKSGHEIDFVLRNKKNNSTTAIECKFLTGQDDSTLASLAKNFEAFRHHYPQGENLVVASNIDTSIKRHCNDLPISFVSAHDLIKEIIEAR
jgi:predicted AAA+ superfamily ATPase